MPARPTPGTLHIVATPIGNLDDVTYRAVKVLGDVDLIAAEDTRRAAKLLTRYGITTPRTSFHEHNERQKAPQLLARLEHGESIAVVSDAGTPLVSDPGSHLVRAALKKGLRVEAVPGPCAVITALVTSGFLEGSFSFVGFSPNRSKARKSWFSALRSETKPVVFFEPPHRLKASLADLKDTLGEREIAVCRELTKVHEESISGRVSEVLERLPPARGELTIVIKPQAGQKLVPPALPEGPQLIKEFGHITETGLGRRPAIRKLASRYGISSRRIYAALEKARTVSVK